MNSLPLSINKINNKRFKINKLYNRLHLSKIYTKMRIVVKLKKKIQNKIFNKKFNQHNHLNKTMIIYKIIQIIHKYKLLSNQSIRVILMMMNKKIIKFNNLIKIKLHKMKKFYKIYKFKNHNNKQKIVIYI